jgi:putative transposase
MPRSRYRFLGEDAPYFMTMTVNQWLPVFTRPDTVDIVLDSWRWLQQHEDFRLHGYVILENHLHLVARSTDISATIKRSKSYTARAIIDHLRQRNVRGLLDLMALFKRVHKTESTYQFWEEGSHPQRVRPLHDVISNSTPPRTDRSSAKTAPIVRRYERVRAD